jgi:RimJ/RimL family protein N-acetyltransferase
MQVVALRQPGRIRPFLRADRFFADYALGDLDAAHFQFTEWFGAEENGELRAVVMLYHDLNPSIFFATGEARGIEAILGGAVKLPRIGLSIHEEHLPALERFYRAEPVPMLKMALLPEDFPQDSESKLAHTRRIAAMGRRAQPDGERWCNTNRLKPRVPTSVWKLLRLDVSHMPLLEELYSYGGGDAFRRRSLEHGVFYGVFDTNRLVSVAGTHIVSECEHIAALGSVMTHPGYRGQGLATMATSAVCEELLERGIELIGLSVSRSNVAAIRVYEKIGFKRRVPFFEGTAVKKESEVQL